MKRRTFLASTAAALACRPDAGDQTDTGLPPVTLPSSDPCADDVAVGTLVREQKFLDEPERELENLSGVGLDGRQVLDLTTLSAAELVVPQERLFVRTAQPPGLEGNNWEVTVGGLIEAPVTLSIEAILAQTQDMGIVHFECSGNTNFGGFGLQGAVAFSGVPFAWVLDQIAPLPEATAILVSGFDDHPPPTGNSTPGASWVFRPEQLQDAFLATHINGEPLTPDHGWPVRLMVPGWYGCVCIKWLDRITWVDDDEPATSQMLEFASRTNQDGAPPLARDFAPANVDVAAVPIRVEVWDVEGTERSRVVGLVWGGEVLPEGLRLWADDVDVGLVEVCPDRESPRTWALWHALLPESVSGRTDLTLTVDDPGVVTRRLDEGYYLRTVRIP